MAASDGCPKVVPMIEQTAEFYRRVALKADDETLVRACLLLACHQLERYERERGRAPPLAVNDT